MAAPNNSSRGVAGGVDGDSNEGSGPELQVRIHCRVIGYRDHLAGAAGAVTDGVLLNVTWTLPYP